jgi:hypothetical protein
MALLRVLSPVDLSSFTDTTLPSSSYETVTLVETSRSPECAVASNNSSNGGLNLNIATVIVGIGSARPVVPADAVDPANRQSIATAKIFTSTLLVRGEA